MLDLVHSPARMARITLRPRITVVAGTDVRQVQALVHQAHEECYIANTLAVRVAVMAAITLAEPSRTLGTEAPDRR